MPAQASLMQFLAVGLGGFIGACSRFLIQNTGSFDEKHLSTMLINITGSFIIGVAWTLLSSFESGSRWTGFIITGVLGGYTTYSSFSLDFVRLTQQGRWIDASVYAGLTTLGAIAACLIGVFITSRILKLLQ